MVELGRRRPRALLVHARVVPHGGGQAVAAWTVQALKDVVDLTVLSWTPPDLEGINRFFGTSIAASDFRSELVSGLIARVANGMASPTALLERAVLQRRCRELDRRAGYDVLISTDNEMDFGRRGLQYVHFPYVLGASLRPRDRWYDRVPGLVVAYQSLCARLGGWSTDRVSRNLTFANSDFVAERLRNLHGIEARMMFPPVPGGFPDVTWEARQPGFAFVGRIHPAKRLLESIEILERVRGRGHDLRFVIFGTRDVSSYFEQVQATVAARREWIELAIELPRREMVDRVARQRYGLMAMHDEHFGIGVAELLRAGCLPFVHDSGGAREIVGQQPLLRFASDYDAVDQIDRVLSSEQLQVELRAALAERRSLYTEERFVREMRHAVMGLAGAEVQADLGVAHRQRASG